jgi:hypothetical protein
MDIPDTKSRSQLKGYFVKNAIPTEGQFADLIEAGINQRDDGLVKAKGKPLSIEAGGDDNSQKRVLSLFRNATDPDPACVLSLNPFGNPADPNTRVVGLGIGDASGNTRLYLDPTTGRMGLGTVKPDDMLHVHNGDIRIAGGRYRRLKIVSDSYWAGIEIVARANDGHPHIDFTKGDLDSPNYGVRLYAPNNDSLVVNGGKLQADGAVHCNNSDIYFSKTDHTHTGIGNTPGWAAIENASNYDALMILGRKTDSGRRVKVWDYLQVHGTTVANKIGIGTTNPKNELDVNGDIRSTRIELESGWGDWIFLKQKRSTGGGGFHIHNPWKDSGTDDGNRLEIGYQPASGSNKWGQLVIHGPSGNVGIGTTTPKTKLDVSGVVTVSGGAKLNEIGIGTQPHGAVPYPYETIQLDPRHNLRIYFGQKQRFFLQNNGQFTIYFDKGRWVFQADGNLVKYNKANQALWALNKVSGHYAW